jgi:hypothetical protein
MAKSDLKTGDKVVGRFQNMNINLIVAAVETDGSYVQLKHDAGEVRVRRQDINDDRIFDLEVKRRG